MLVSIIDDYFININVWFTFKYKRIISCERLVADYNIYLFDQPSPLPEAIETQ